MDLSMCHLYPGHNTIEPPQVDSSFPLYINHVARQVFNFSFEVWLQLDLAVTSAEEAIKINNKHIQLRQL